MAGGYGHGVTVGDFDNDGHPDLFVTRWRSLCPLPQPGRRHVRRRHGQGRARRRPRLADFGRIRRPRQRRRPRPLRLPLRRLGRRAPHALQGPDRATIVVACDPTRVRSRGPTIVFRNDGGRFVDVTAEAGIVDRDGRGLGVVAADLDGDGRIDLFVANDTRPITSSATWAACGSRRWATQAGVAANAGGGYQAGMGVACGDLDGDGRLDLAVTNFYGESTTLFHNLGGGLFADQTAAVGLAAPSRYLLGFGVAFLDANNDGRLDLVTANGHVNDFRPQFPYQMPAQLFRGKRDGRFRKTSPPPARRFQRFHVGRGLAVGDLDNDGRVDAVMVAKTSPSFISTTVPIA